MVKKNQVAYGVRVVLNDKFIARSLAEKYLQDEPVLYIGYQGAYNDAKGDYVYVYGGSMTNSGPVYLDEIDLQYPIPEIPLYQLYQGVVEGHPEIKCSHQYSQNVDGIWRCIYCSAEKPSGS